jgi:hypothetical protein
MNRSWKIGLASVAILAIGCGLLLWLKELRRQQDAEVHAWLYRNGYIDAWKLCPWNQVLEFKVGTRSFFMRWAWVHDLGKRLWVENAGKCPTEPVEVGGFFMRMPGDVARERNLHFFIFEFGRDSESWRLDQRPIPSNPASRVTYGDGGYVEDVTDAWNEARLRDNLRDAERYGHALEKTRQQFEDYVHRSNGRYWRLHHAANPDGTAAAPVMMSCFGTSRAPAGRQCHILYRYQPDLVIKYDFWVKDGGYPYSDAELKHPSGPAEPGELLGADARVRQWIEDLQKRP